MSFCNFEWTPQAKGGRGGWKFFWELNFSCSTATLNLEQFGVVDPQKLDNSKNIAHIYYIDDDFFIYKFIYGNSCSQIDSFSLGNYFKFINLYGILISCMLRHFKYYYFQFKCGNWIGDFPGTWSIISHLGYLKLRYATN